MSKLKRLIELQNDGSIANVWRDALDDHKLSGYVIRVSKKLLLVHLINGNTLELEGYAAIRIRDITSVQADKSFVSRAMKLLNRQPVVLDSIVIDSWSNLLDSLHAAYPVVGIELEKKRPGTLYIGPVIELTDKHATIKKIDYDGKWAECARYAYKDITQVTFDNGYHLALFALVEHEAGAAIKTVKS